MSDITDKAITLSWSIPESDGGSRILGYYIEKCDTSTDRWVKVNRSVTKDTTFRVEDLTAKTEYRFRVSAENKPGTGPASKPSESAIAKLPYGKFIFFYQITFLCILLNMLNVFASYVINLVTQFKLPK